MATLQDFIDARGGEYPCPQTNACTDATLLFSDDFQEAQAFGVTQYSEKGDNYYWIFSSYTDAGGGDGFAELLADETEHIGVIRIHEDDTDQAYSETFLSIDAQDENFVFHAASDAFQGYAPQVCDEFHFALRWHPGDTVKEWVNGSVKKNIRFGFSYNPPTEHSFQHCSTLNVQQGNPSADVQAGAFFRACDPSGNWEAVVGDLVSPTAPYPDFGESTADTGVAITPDEWQCFRIRVIDASTLGFKVDDGDEVTIDGFTSPVLTGYNAQTYWLLGGGADGSAYMDVDYVFVINGNCEECAEPGTGPGSGGQGLCPQGPDGTGGRGLCG